MRRSSEPEERAQFTVAELLARYGEEAPRAGRRHRRADEGPGTVADTGAQSAAERSRVGTREATIRPSEPLSLPDLPARHGSPPADSPPRDLFASNPARPQLNRRAGRPWAPAVGPSSVAAGRVLVTPPPVTPPLIARRAPLSATARCDGAVTDQLPRLDPAPATGVIPTQHDDPLADEVQAPDSSSPWWEWAVMVSQIGVGVVVGAALWLICEWLWQRIPVVALAVALAMITALVWVVRRLRRAEDLQTTVIAVLVGLFVTVSPAALLLVGR